MIGRASVCALFAAAVVGAGILAPGCGDDPVVCDQADCLTAEGWNLFKSGEYESAADRFNSAVDVNAEYADAYNGLGWSYLNLDSLGWAVAAFDTAILKGASSADPFAGQAAGFRDLDELTDHFEKSVAASDSALLRERR